MNRPKPRNHVYNERNMQANNL